MSYGLTPRQLDALRYIAGHIEERGYSPSYRDICKALGLKSTGAVARIIDALEYRGHVTRIPDCARSLALTVTR